MSNEEIKGEVKTPVTNGEINKTNDADKAPVVPKVPKDKKSQKTMRDKIIESGKMISLRLPRTKIGYENVQINGVLFRVKTGQTVEVPSQVAEMLNHKLDAEEMDSPLRSDNVDELN